MTTMGRHSGIFVAARGAAPKALAARGWFPPRGNRPPHPELARAQAGLTIPVAVLAAASGTPAVTVNTEAVPTAGRPEQRVAEVRLAYPGGLDVITHRLDRGDPVFYLVWQALIGHRLAAATPPADRPPARSDALHRVSFDGTAAEWHGFEAPASAGPPLAACGGIVGAAIVVAAGPRSFLQGLSLTSWPAPPD